MTNEQKTHIDLFSGIGGFALAADRVFGNVEHVFCEIDPFAQETLKKHWPDAPIYGDIRTLTHADFKRRIHGGSEKLTAKGPHKAQRQSLSSAESPFILTGGFPCQPFSQAGRRKGEADDRYLWPEMLRVIREFSPLWVIAENVRGLLTQGGGVVFERVCTDLEAAGYEVQPLIIPAVAVGAPHRRDRVWFIAHRKGEDGSRLPERTSAAHAEFGKSNSHAPDTEHNGRDGAKDTQSSRTGNERDTQRTHELCQSKRNGGLWAETPNWDENWLEVAARLCRMDDGVSSVVDRIRLIDYIRENGSKGESEITQTSAESDSAYGMRVLRLYLKTAEASLQGIASVDESKNFVPKVPHKGGYEKRQVGSWKKEEEKMRHLQALVSSKESCKQGKDMLAKMPLDIREAQRILAVASQRNPRLKALGNAIVPAVAEQIMRAIQYAESNPHA